MLNVKIKSKMILIRLALKFVNKPKFEKKILFYTDQKLFIVLSVHDVKVKSFLITYRDKLVKFIIALRCTMLHQLCTIRSYNSILILYKRLKSWS